MSQRVRRREKVQGQTSNSTDLGKVSHSGACSGFSRSEGAGLSDPGACRIRLMNVAGGGSMRPISRTTSCHVMSLT